MARVTFLLTCLLAYLLSSRSLRRSRSSAGRGARRRSHLCSRGASSAAPATDAAIAAEPPSRRLRRRCRFRHRNVYCRLRLAPHCMDVATQPPTSLQPRRPSVSPLVVYTTICYMYMYVQPVFPVLLYTLHNAYRVVSAPPRAAPHCEIHSDSHSTLVFFRVCCEILLNLASCFLLEGVALQDNLLLPSLSLSSCCPTEVSDEEVSSLRDTRQMSEGRERRPRRCTRARGAPHRPTRSRRMLQASPSRRLPRTCPQGPTASGMS